MGNKTIILSCTSLKDYVGHAQKKLNTNIPVKYISRIYHRDPAEMREHIIEALEELTVTGQGTGAGDLRDTINRAGQSTDGDLKRTDPTTVLVAMGYCGGSWDKVPAPCRIVIPRVDDCISLLLQQTDEPISNLKTEGHLYVKDKDPSKESFRRIFEHMAEGLDDETVAKYHEHWKDLYSAINVIETEVNGADRKEYLEAVKADADWLAADMNIVKGGTHLLEKLISGDWDAQFLIVEPGKIVVDVLECVQG